MTDINDIMPKIPGLKWGALTNLPPTLDTIERLHKSLKHDGRWHTVFKTDHGMNIDGVSVIRKTRDSMT